MTSILAGPATHNAMHGHHANYSKSQTTKHHPHSSKKRGNTALPSDSGARAMLMHGIQNPLSQSNQIISSMTAGRPQGHEVSSPLMANAPLMNMAENEGPSGSLVADSNINSHLNVESAASQLQLNAHSNQSLHLVQTKQDHEKRSTDPFFETQNLQAYGQAKLRTTGASPGKQGKKLSLSQLKNRKYSKFNAVNAHGYGANDIRNHGYGLRSQSPGRSPGKSAPGGGDSQIDI